MKTQTFLIRANFSSFFAITGSSSYHQNQNRRSARYPDREKDRLERLERERMHARDRDMIGYNLNDDELINDRHYGRDRDVVVAGVSGVGGTSSGSEYPMHRDRGGGGGGGGVVGGVDDRRVLDRDLRAVDRERDPRDARIDARDRREHYVGSNSNSSRHLMNNSYDNDNVDLIREKEKERFAHRRDEYNYSPHRGNRRVLNMNAM